jgi:hypothetical protein
MAKQHVKTLFLAIIAVAGATALAIQLGFAIAKTSISATESIVRYFSFFTIQSNIFVTVCAACLLIKPRSKWGHFFSSPKVTSAITVYIIIVGLVYNTVLRKLYHLLGLERFANELLHVFIPVTFLLYWTVFVPKKQLTWNVFPWLIYPLLYGVYVLIRGAFVKYYPYPFLNVLKIGYLKVMVSFVVLLVFFLMVSLILVAIGKIFFKKANE